MIALILVVSCVPYTRDDYSTTETAFGVSSESTPTHASLPTASFQTGSPTQETLTQSADLHTPPGDGAPRSPDRFTQVLISGLAPCGAISDDGKFLALQEFSGRTPLDGPEVVLWSEDLWAARWRADAWPLCDTLDFSPDNHYLAAGTRAGGKNVHPIVTLKSVQDGINKLMIVDFYHALDLDFSPDGSSLAIANGTVYLYDLIDLPPYSEQEWTVTPTRSELRPDYGSDSFSDVEFSPTGSMLAIGTDGGNLLLWRPGEASPFGNLDMSEKCRFSSSRAVSHIDFSFDGSLVAAVTCAQEWILLSTTDFSTLIDIRLPYKATASKFHPDLLVGAIGFSGGISLVDAEKGDELCRLNLTGQTPSTIGFSKEGDILMAISIEGFSVSWNIERCLDNLAH